MVAILFSANLLPFAFLPLAIIPFYHIGLYCQYILCILWRFFENNRGRKCCKKYNDNNITEQKPNKIVGCFLYLIIILWCSVFLYVKNASFLTLFFFF